MLTADSIALPFCSLVALLLQLENFGAVVRYGITPHIFIAAITIAVFVASGLYRAVIRFIDQRLLTAAGVGLGIVLALAYSISFSLNDRTLLHSAVMIYGFIAFSYVVTSRLVVRAFLRGNNGKSPQQKDLVAIFGAGTAGVRLAQALRDDHKYRVFCFFDDKQSLNNKIVAGLNVFHASRLTEIVQQNCIGLVVLAIPSATAERRRQVVHLIHEAGAEIKTVRNLLELADEKSSPQSIREIKIEDLLGRRPVPPQIELFAKCVQGKSVLITGAGGSIGSELCRQILALSPSQLHLLDHSEFALYTIKQALCSRAPTMPIHAHLGSVCDAQLVEHIMQEGKIDTIYHAAAYKHVCLVETNVAEGIRNNVIGAQVVAAAAHKCRAQTCVLVSTDKAVRPTNVMGASKRITELIFQAAAAKPGTATTFSMVRFGNVLGSSGSVVPLFQKQIEQGGPITITHPDVERYFMLISEAAQLVIQAGAMAKGGEIFLLDMGEPVKIIDLARTMIDMAGLKEKNEQTPDGNIEIRCIGLRPGEKLCEELLIGDDVAASAHPRIMCTTEYSFTPEILNRLIDNLIQECCGKDNEVIKAVIQKIVKEYTPHPNDDLLPSDENLPEFLLQMNPNSESARSVAVLASGAK